MHEGSIVVAHPSAATQLVLLFHGVGSSAESLAPIAEAIAQARPEAAVVSVAAPHPSSLGSGKEWFSVIGITEQNRPQRIAAVMPLFQETVRHWQQWSGVGPQGTVLVGFSQGAIMSLEATQTLAADGVLATAVISLAGRFAQAVRQAPSSLRFHLIHGEQDNVVATRWSIEAAQSLKEQGASVTLDLLPGLGHGIDARALRLVTRHLGGPAPGNA
jgi:phospholipase/carboxylesterase